MWADAIVTGGCWATGTCTPRSGGRGAFETVLLDGSWMEGAPSYHSQVVGMLSGVSAVADFRPLGYQAPRPVDHA